MVGTNVKAETMAMIEKRSGIEAEMNAIIDRLCVPNGPGISGSLLDAEGFPRSDIDVAAVRSSRQRLAILRNDHKDITEKIDQNLQILLSGGHLRDSPMPPQRRTDAATSENPTPMDEDAIVRLPFAVVDEIFDGSPAASDGLQRGDQILKFGSVDGGENLVSRLAREGQTNQGSAIPVIVMRRGVQVNLNVTPRPWSGRGLLGCHFRWL